MTGRRRRDQAAPAAAGVPTHAQLYRDAVWGAGPDQLTPAEALVLLTYANHARGTDRAWVAQRRLVQQCKVRSHTTVVRLRRVLVDKGWLEPLGTVPVRGGRATVYRLTIPESGTASGSLWDDWDDESGTASGSLWREESGTASGSLRDESGTVQHRKRYSSAPKAVQFSTESGTAAVPDSLDSRDSLGPESQANTAAAPLRAATAFAEDQPGDSPVTAEAKRQIRETLKGARRAELWRWQRGPAPAGPPAQDHPEPQPNLNGQGPT